MYFILLLVVLQLLPFSLNLNNTALLIISARSSKRCHFPEGDFLISLFQKSLTDYSNRHGYSFSFRSDTPFVALQGHWNKIGQLMEALNSENINKYNWIMWIDNDTLVCQPSRPLDFHKYDDYDVIIKGVPGEFEKELPEKIDMYKALNTGVILMKVNDASRNFLNEISAMALWSAEEKRERLREKFVNYENIQDQAVITYFVYQSMMAKKLNNLAPKADAIRIYIESDDYLNGYWETHQGSLAEKVLFKHWAGCKFCEEAEVNPTLKQKCTADYLQDYTRFHIDGHLRGHLNNFI